MLNVCFGLSSASSLRQALNLTNRREFVLGYADNLAMGPIADVQGQERKSWLFSYYGDDGGLTSQYWSESDQFWKELGGAASSTLRVWLSRRCTFELAAFSHFASTLPPDYQFELVDLSDAFIKTKPGLGVLNPAELAEGFHFCRKACAAEFKSDCENWKLLQFQNSNLRVFANRKLVSVSDDYFDGTILRHAQSDWKKAAYVVGNCLVDEVIQPGTVEVSDCWLFNRIWKQVELGVLEAESEATLPSTRIRLRL